MKRQIYSRAGMADERDLLTRAMLIEEYVAEFRAGRQPGPESYVARYIGPKKAAFEEDLDFAIFLEKVCKQSRKGTGKTPASTQMNEIKQFIQQKVRARLNENEARFSL